MIKNVAKTFGGVLLSVALCSVSAVCFAATGNVSGTVQYLRTHNAANEPAWAPPLFWFTLTGVTSAGACTKGTTPSVVFIGDDTQALAIITSALASGELITVHYDDTKLINAACVAEYITVGSPAGNF